MQRIYETKHFFDMVYENCTSAVNCSLGPSLLNLCTLASHLQFIIHLEDAALKTDVISRRSERVKPIDIPDDVYDFVVVGSGAGGSVVASRLSENPEWNILLMEAGHDEPVALQIPAMTRLALTEGEVNWSYRTINETTACLAKNGSCTWDSGKMLGGSTSHNGMSYLRGNPADYNYWAELGNEGWAWDDVLPYFKKGEDNGEIERVGTEYHSTGGPLSVKRFSYVPPFAETIFAAAAELGHNITEDLNGAQGNGWTETQMMAKNGVRHSAAAAYLRPARDRKNLHVSLNTFGTRVIVENGVAVGVEYLKNGELRKAMVRKEVILSAGSKRSPQLLLLSGIGPADDLESFGIDVVKNLPGVGRNLHDHIVNYLTVTINESDTFDNDYDVLDQYLKDQTGPMAALGLHSISSMLASSRATSDYPDIQIGFNGYEASCASGGVGDLRSAGKRSLTMRTVVLRTKSRGFLTLASKDPVDPPAIIAGYFTDPEDLDLLVEGTGMAVEIINTKVMKAHNMTLLDAGYEKCAGYTLASDEYWRCVLTQSDPGYGHDVGSCKMGPASDPLAVVDPQLRVYGISNLRVIDASIMPQITSSNTGGPTMMIGEHGADMIKKHYGYEA